MKKILPNFEFEKDYGEKKFIVIGVDEVGRGALAGPVVAGAVSISNVDGWLSLGVDDSKRLTTLKREKLARIIKKNAAWGIGEASVADIDRLGIVKATEKAMRLAIANIMDKASENNKIGNKTYVLIDAFNVKHIRGVGLKNQKAIIRGDQKSISIAAASIVAKVHRDNLMERIAGSGKRLELYKLGKNKGYGTKEHLRQIKKYGISKQHRKLFVRKILS